MKHMIVRVTLVHFRVIVWALLVMVSSGVGSGQELVGNSKKTPLDELKAADIPAAERFPWQPKSLVAVYGSHAWHYWETDAIQLTTDGKRVTVRACFVRGTLRVFDAATSKDLAVFSLPRDRAANGAGFSLNGRLVALCQQNEFDWTTTVWDVATKKVQYRVNGKGASPSRVYFSPNGKLLAYSHAGVQFFELPTGKYLFAAPQGHAHAPLFHPTGARVYYDVVPTDFMKWPPRSTQLFEFDIAKRKERMLFDQVGFYPYNLTSLPGAAFAIAPDGRWLAAALYPDDPKTTSHVQLVNLIDNKLGAKIDCGGWYPVSNMAFSPDNKSLALAYRDRVHFHERGSGKLIRSFDPGASGLENLTFSPDGKFLAATSPSSSRLLLWDLTTDKAVHEVTESSRVLAVSPDSSCLLVEVKYGPAPRLVLLDLPTGRQLPIEPLKSQKDVKCGSFSPDGRNVALIIGLPGASAMRIIETRTGKDTAIPGQEVYLTCNGTPRFVFFRPDGKKLVAAGGDRCDVWDLKARTAQIGKYPWLFVDAVVSQDGTTLLADTTENIKVIDLAKLEVVKYFVRDKLNFSLVALSRDGTKVAHASGDEGKVQVWTMKDGEMLYEFKGHIQPVTALCFDRKGETLFTAGYDGRLIRWFSATTKQEWRVPGVIRSIQLSPEGRHVLVNNSNGTAYVLRVEDAE